MADDMDLEKESDLENVFNEEDAQGIAMELLLDFKEHSRRMDEHNRQLIGVLKVSAISFAATIISIVLIFFGGILIFLNQYEFENYSQDGSGYNNINTGTQGDVNNGTEIPGGEEEEREGKGDDSQKTIQQPKQ